MNLDELKSHVAAALHDEWAAFAAKHPHLSAAIEETAWVTVLAESLHDDPAFVAAMNNAQTMGTLIDQAQHIVRGFVQQWLARIG